ncbi:hypothetical protein AUP68_01269 [Ilyonectria robusta]
MVLRTVYRGSRTVRGAAPASPPRGNLTCPMSTDQARPYSNLTQYQFPGKTSRFIPTSSWTKSTPRGRRQHRCENHRHPRWQSLTSLTCFPDHRPPINGATRTYALAENGQDSRRPACHHSSIPHLSPVWPGLVDLSPSRSTFHESEPSSRFALFPTRPSSRNRLVP